MSSEEEPVPGPELSPEGEARAHKLSGIISLGLLMIPIGGVATWHAINAVFDRWLNVTPEITYWQACGVMTLLWFVRIFMYR